ncbi:PadR family transcriptional regulator [Vibrio sp.]|nr:PadR family transcriptional regulator [Vibrio sp.]
MSLPHVILTVLSTRNATGYDITKEFSSSIGYFWKASHQQVYRELNKMAVNEYVTCVLEPQEGKPDRKVYSITEAGRAALREWFQKPTSHNAVRDEFSAKLMACSVETSPSFQHNLVELIEESRRFLTHFKELEATEYANKDNLDKTQRIELLTLRRNMFIREAWIEWAEEVVSELQEIESIQA